MLLSLMEDLEGVRLLSNQVDVWRWKLEEMGVFSVSSAYKKLEGLVLREVLWREDEKGVFAKLWKSPAPSKVVAFAWRVLLNRIPTKGNLVLRNVLATGDNSLCVLCNRTDESAVHLLLHCDVASAVWLKLMWWLDRFFPSPPNLFVHWECWQEGERNKNVKKGLGVIWLATLWVLWKCQNDKVYNDVNFEVDVMVEEVKVLAWKWVMNRMTIPVCLFFEWCWNPQWCLSRSPSRL